MRVEKKITNGTFYYNTQKVIVKGKGKMINQLYKTIDCESKNIKFI